MCIWICFQSYKFIFHDNKIDLNLEDESNYLNEYLTFNNYIWKQRNIHLIIKKINIIIFLSKDNNINRI